MNFLACDIGGTKTLLAIYYWKDGIKERYKKQYSSRDWDSFYLILSDFLEKMPNQIEKPRVGCIGIAGRVSNNSCHLTNLSWEISSKKVCERTSLDQVELINDFSVILYGLNHLNDHQYVVIQEGYDIKPLLRKGMVAVLGAGTGLGMARGIVSDNGITPLASEGGHSEFAPRSDEEWALRKWIKRELSIERVSVERIVSGTGLGHIACWKLMQSEAKSHPLRSLAENSRAKKKTIQADLPSIASQYAMHGDKLMVEALEMWLSAYGSAAGDFALKELCYSGLWIGGGTASKHLKGITSITFKEAFRNKGRFKDLMRRIPVIALIDPEVGLFSAACRAHILSSKMGDLAQ
ncbi:glucokinase [Prochlorococcus sp. MIT 1223]|uniref:glucokinase n=1 Tax=Prochlorococcus sp. MIT 1223 TaxID=3096217 RepID=UPI002A76479C|nr:glucokinase [Prochlorococcus sp. MIT 1223]